MKRIFKLHWLDKTTEEISVSCSKETSQMEACSMAMNMAGIGRGALAALDYWEEII
jgi:hypothetical protein